MKKKRWMAAGLAAVMTLSLAACGSSGGDSDSGNQHVRLEWKLGGRSSGI